jgi:Heparinase II/III-like protein/Heparinase II/III N-terminus
MLLEAMDCALTTVTLKADSIGSQYSWRLGRFIHLISTEMHQALRMVSRLGWNATTPELVKSCQQQATKAVPRYYLHRGNSSERSYRARELLRGNYPVGENSAVPLETLSWLRAPFKDSTGESRFLFHVLYDVRELLDEYCATGNAKYLAGAKTLASRWISECLYTERWPNVWDDHCTALRGIFLCQLWAAARENEPPASDFMRELLSAIVRHAEKLAHEAFYRPHHNHGVTQAYALLAIGLLFSLHPKAAGWAVLGRLRLEEQMAQNVSPEGIHREHTPLYHFYVFDQFNSADQLARAHGTTFSEGFNRHLQAMLASGAHLLKPDGSPPAVGDSAKDSTIRIEEEDLKLHSAESVGNYLYSRTMGRKGTPPTETSVLLPGAGYACFRSGWGKSENITDERFLICRTATFKTTHIHHDVFSFELYAYGDDLIVDSGGPYSYGHAMRENYFVSTASHNTVVIDGLNQEVGEARILRWQSNPAYDLLDAEHHNYPAVTHRRAILFVRPDYFIILDRLDAASRHCYSQLFHLNPNLHAELRDLTITTVNSLGGPTLKIVPLIVDGLGISFHRGNTSPAQGWVCVGDEVMVPGTVVDFQCSGTTAAFAALIVPEAPRRYSRVWGGMQGVPFQDETRINIGCNVRRDEIWMSPDGQVTIKR